MRLRIAKIPIPPAPILKIIKRRKSFLSVLTLSPHFQEEQSFHVRTTGIACKINVCKKIIVRRLLCVDEPWIPYHPVLFCAGVPLALLQCQCRHGGCVFLGRAWSVSSPRPCQRPRLSQALLRDKRKLEEVDAKDVSHAGSATDQPEDYYHAGSTEQPDEVAERCIICGGPLAEPDKNKTCPKCRGP